MYELDFINYNKNKYDSYVKVIELLRIGNYALNLIRLDPGM